MKIDNIITCSDVVNNIINDNKGQAINTYRLVDKIILRWIDTYAHIIMYNIHVHVVLYIVHICIMYNIHVHVVLYIVHVYV